MLVDSHCHLKDTRYGKTPSEIVEDSEKDGVVGFINVSTSLQDSFDSSEISRKIKSVYSTVGIYPHSDLGKNPADLCNELEKIIDNNPKIVGIGECGIDIPADPSKAEDYPLREVNEQKELFEYQIELALKKNIPVMIHNRNGDEIVLDILSNYKSRGLKTIAHCFSSNYEIAKKFLSLGTYISFSGMITYPSRHDLREVVAKVPDDMFLVETDSPWLPPQGHRGELNYPKYVKIVAEKVSQVKEKPYDIVASLSTSNACRLFNINL